MKSPITRLKVAIVFDFASVQTHFDRYTQATKRADGKWLLTTEYTIVQTTVVITISVRFFFFLLLLLSFSKLHNSTRPAKFRLWLGRGKKGTSRMYALEHFMRKITTTAKKCFIDDWVLFSCQMKWGRKKKKKKRHQAEKRRHQGKTFRYNSIMQILIRPDCFFGGVFSHRPIRPPALFLLFNFIFILCLLVVLLLHTRALFGPSPLSKWNQSDFFLLSFPVN